MKKHLHLFSLLLVFAATTTQAQITKLSNNSNLLYGLPLNGKFLLIGSDSTLWSTDGTAANTKKYTTKVTFDINTGGAAILNNKLYFSGKTASNGIELWVTDGTDAGTSLVKDIKTGTGSSFPKNLAVIGNTIYFSADDGSHGTEFWKTDGTGAGTVLVKDINPGSPGGMDSSNWYLNGNTLLFTANDGTHGYEAWSSDGTAANTKMLKDIAPGAQRPDFGVFMNLGNKTVFEAFVGGYFIGNAQLWVTDGTPAGTTMLKDFGAFSAAPSIGFVTFKNKLYIGAGDITQGIELWSTDGTVAGTAQVKDINPGTGNNSTPFLSSSAIFGNKFMFSATTEGAGYEPWVTDGTAANTTQLKDINPGFSSSSPFIFSNYGSTNGSTALYNGKIFFAADDGTHGNELWTTDGTTANTKIVKDIQPGSGGAMDGFSGYFYTNSGLYFGSDDGSHGVELWKSDGTAAGTTMVKDIYSGAGGSYPRFLGIYNNHLLMLADDGDNGDQLLDLYSIDATVTALPVNLTKLTATPIKEDVRVEWATATEINTSNFKVQRSIDGNKFEDVGTVQASGNSTTPQDYSFVDMGAMHTNAPVLFYRLQVNDKDGKQSYSTIVPVKVSGEAISARVYPNPASDFVILSYNMQNSSKATITVTDARGKTMISKALTNTGSNQTSIDVKTLPAGVYYVRFITDKGTQSTRFIKQP